MSLDIRTKISAITSHALASGYFERVNTHEPKSAPGTGLTAAVFLSGIGPADSGLAATSVRLEFTLRIFIGMLMEPQDDIDLVVGDAADALMTAYTGDFELGGNVRNIDLLGRNGTPLSLRPGYVEIDRKLFRFADIVIPLILNDVWEQVA